MKVIVLHDYFERLEGGGRLSSLIAQHLPADMAYGFARQSHPFLDTIPIQHNLQAYSRLPLWRQFKLSQAFSQRVFFLKNYEVAIYSGFYTPLAVTHSKGCNILYCHTPPRFIYDQRDFYLNRLPPVLRPLLKFFIHYLQPRYELAIDSMDKIVANSRNVQQRIAYYLKKDSMVIHPPCETQRFQWKGQQNYYLSTARLDPLKRVDKIIQAFIKMPNKQLVVTSDGSEFAHLRKLAQNASNIKFTGAVSDEKLAELIAYATAIIYVAKDEDFGMSPLEAMAAGKPVIGVAEGGLLETIIPNETGLLINPSQDSIEFIENICESINKMNRNNALMLRTACEQQAKHFDTRIFIEKIRNLLP